MRKVFTLLILFIFLETLSLTGQRIDSLQAQDKPRYENRFN
jgi:hypothetical protein